MTPLWWGWAALVWGYALSWFLVTDPIKLLAYRILDATKSLGAVDVMQSVQHADGVRPNRRRRYRTPAEVCARALRALGKLIANYGQGCRNPS